jgi:hypothetical protein
MIEKNKPGTIERLKGTMMETIDIKHRSHDSAFLAQLIWEKLFRLTRAEKFPYLLDFLCDLKIFQNIIEDSFLWEGEASFYWAYDRNSGYTDTRRDTNANSRTFYKVEITPNEIIFTPAPAP